MSAKHNPFALDGCEVAPPHLPIALLESDDRALEIELVRSTLDFLNLHANDRRTLDCEQTRAFRIARAFGWVPGVMKSRALRVGTPPDLVAWQRDQRPDAIDNAIWTAALSIGPFQALVAVNGSISVGGRNRDVIEWLDQSFSAAPIYSRMRLDKDGFSTVSVPVLQTVQACVAYAIGCVLRDDAKPETDRLGLRARIRQCPYRNPRLLSRLAEAGRAMQLHLFLDARLDDGGNLLPGKQDYCCPQHANRYRQAAHREKNVAERMRSTKK